jgi:hypothetical protein
MLLGMGIERRCKTSKDLHKARCTFLSAIHVHNILVGPRQLGRRSAETKTSPTTPKTNTTTTFNLALKVSLSGSFSGQPYL